MFDLLGPFYPGMCGWVFSLTSSMTRLISGSAFRSFCNIPSPWCGFALLGECGLSGREGSCSSYLCVCVSAVPSVLLLFSLLHPQALVRPQPAHGLGEKVCLRLLLIHILGREVENFCWWIYLGSASGGSCCFQAILQVTSLKLLQISRSLSGFALICFVL